MTWSTSRRGGYTALEAAVRVQGGMAPAPADICSYLREIQREID